jgi:hypothetical protein
MATQYSNSQSRQKSVLVLPTSSGRLRCGLLTSNVNSHYPFFVAITIDDDDAHIYRYQTETLLNVPKLICCGCEQSISNTNGQVNHTSLSNGALCSGSSEEVRREAQWAICRWAAFHTNLQAKAAGKDIFSKEDWQDFMRSIGFGQVKELNEEKYQILKTFIDRLEAKPFRLHELVRRVKAGEQLVESTNKLPPWNKRPNVRETASSTKSLHVQTSLAQMATQSSPQDTSGTQHHSTTGCDNKVVTHFKNFHLNFNSRPNVFYTDHSQSRRSADLRNLPRFRQ